MYLFCIFVYVYRLQYTQTFLCIIDWPLFKETKSKESLLVNLGLLQRTVAAQIQLSAKEARDRQGLGQRVLVPLLVGGLQDWQAAERCPWFKLLPLRELNSMVFELLARVNERQAYQLIWKGKSIDLEECNWKGI